MIKIFTILLPLLIFFSPLFSFGLFNIETQSIVSAQGTTPPPSVPQTRRLPNTPPPSVPQTTRFPSTPPPSVRTPRGGSGSSKCFLQVGGICLSFEGGPGGGRSSGADGLAGPSEVIFELLQKVLGIVFALVFFLFMWNASLVVLGRFKGDASASPYSRRLVYSTFVLFIIFSMWGIIHIIRDIFI